MDKTLKRKLFLRKMQYVLKLPFKVVYNFFFCLKYPFWRSRNVWTDKFIGYRFTLYECIPYGWRKAFGKELSRNLKKALKLSGELKTFRFLQIKEKYGELRLYSGGASKPVLDLLSYYEFLSLAYCQICGKPARYCTDGWISYLCEDCFNKTSSSGERLTIDDVPKCSKLIDGEWVDTDLNIDFETLWDIQTKED